MRKIFVDECGYTGANLLDENQPFQAAAAIEISDEYAAEIISEHFPRHQGPELKYRQLARRKNYLPKLVALQRQLLTSVPCHSYVVDKRFVLIQKFLDTCVEPFYHAAGVDFYQDGCLEQAASLIYHCGPVFFGEGSLNEFLQLFQEVSRQKCPVLLEDLIKKSAAFAAANLDEFFGPLGTANPLAITELMHEYHNTDAAYLLVMGLITLCENRSNDYEIIHDQSENLKLYADAFNQMINVEFQETFRMSKVCQISFPLKLNRLSQIDSKNSSGVQLADILVGGAVDMVKGKTTHRKEDNHYFRELSEVYSEAPEESFIYQFPTMDLNEIRERRKGNQSSEFLDFGVKNIK